MRGGCYSPQQDLLELSEGLHPSEPEHKASPEVTRPTAPGAQRGTGCGVVSRGWGSVDTRSAGKPKATSPSAARTARLPREQKGIKPCLSLTQETGV